MGDNKIPIQKKAPKTTYGRRSKPLLNIAAAPDDAANQFGPDAAEREEEIIMETNEVKLLLQQALRLSQPGMETLEAVREHMRCVAAYRDKLLKRREQLRRREVQMQGQGQGVPPVGMRQNHEEESTCESCISFSDETDGASTS